jgi:hypothetical protein
MRGCSSQNSLAAMRGCEPGSAIRLGIRSPLCSRANRKGDARNARVSSSAAGRILRSAQASVSWSSPAGSRKVNSTSLFIDGRADSRRKDASGPFTDLGGPRHSRRQTAYPLRAQEHRWNGRANIFSGVDTSRLPPGRIPRLELQADLFPDRHRRMRGAQITARRPRESRQLKRVEKVFYGSQATPGCDGRFIWKQREH